MSRIALVVAAAAATLAAFAGPAAPAAPAAPAVPAAPELAIRVHGNHLVDGAGHRVRILGVNFSGAEYACAQGWGIFAGPSDAKAIHVMTTWAINVVRVPLNEDCWLGINAVKKRYGGERYRSAIEGLVHRLHSVGLYVILDLHWNAPGDQKALDQQRMADADHSPDFWASVAARFRDDPAVLFDLYNEPHGISWSCWLNGCTTKDGWKAAGMQQLVDAVRSAGATQPLMIGGPNWSSLLGNGWLQHAPQDPSGQLVASFHLYNFGGCDPKCWRVQVGGVAKHVPVVTGELGEDDCAHGFIDRYMPWADRRGISYLGWSWNVTNCRKGPSLISNAKHGTPTDFGIGLRDHLRALVGAR